MRCEWCKKIPILSVGSQNSEKSLEGSDKVWGSLQIEYIRFFSSCARRGEIKQSAEVAQGMVLHHQTGEAGGTCGWGSVASFLHFSHFEKALCAGVLIPKFPYIMATLVANPPHKVPFQNAKSVRMMLEGPSRVLYMCDFDPDQ